MKKIIHSVCKEKIYPVAKKISNPGSIILILGTLLLGYLLYNAYNELVQTKSPSINWIIYYLSGSLSILMLMSSILTFIGTRKIIADRKAKLTKQRTIRNN